MVPGGGPPTPPPSRGAVMSLVFFDFPLLRQACQENETADGHEDVGWKLEERQGTGKFAEWQRPVSGSVGVRFSGLRCPTCQSAFIRSVCFWRLHRPEVDIDVAGA